MATYRELTGAGVTTRAAASLTGLPRSTVTRRRPAPPVVVEARVPANRLSAAERLEILAVLDAPRFVDLPPIQIFATLLDEGTYLCSISTMYRILAITPSWSSGAGLPAIPPGRYRSWSRPDLDRCIPGTSPNSLDR